MTKRPSSAAIRHLFRRKNSYQSLKTSRDDLREKQSFHDDVRMLKFIKELTMVPFNTIPRYQRTCGLCKKPYCSNDDWTLHEEEVAVVLPCGHVYGHHCIRDWFMPSEQQKTHCPTDGCKASYPVKQEKEKEEEEEEEEDPPSPTFDEWYDRRAAREMLEDHASASQAADHAIPRTNAIGLDPETTIMGSMLASLRLIEEIDREVAAMAAAVEKKPPRKVSPPKPKFTKSARTGFARLRDTLAARRG